MRLNLLKVLRTVCEVHPNRAMLVERYGLLGVVERLSRSGGDGAVLVRELAREIVPTLKPGLKPAVSKTKGGGDALESPATKNGAMALAPKKMRRAASDTSTSSFRELLNGTHESTRPWSASGGSGGDSGGSDNGTSRLGGGVVRPVRHRLGDISWHAVDSPGNRR